MVSRLAVGRRYSGRCLIRDWVTIVCLVVAACVGCQPANNVPFLVIANYQESEISVSIDGTEIGAVACGGTLQVSPGQNGVPALPWSVDIASTTAGWVRSEDVAADQGPLSLTVLSDRLVLGAPQGTQVGPALPTPGCSKRSSTPIPTLSRT